MGPAHRGYKGTKNAANRTRLVDDLSAAAPWLTFGPHEHHCRTSDHYLDAVIAALTASAAHRGVTARPDAQQAAPARTEGWIAIPTPTSLTMLARTINPSDQRLDEDAPNQAR